MSKKMSGFPSMPDTWAGSDTRCRGLRSATPRTFAGAGLLSGALLLLVMFTLSPVASSQARVSAPLARTGLAVGDPAPKGDPVVPEPALRPSRPFASLKDEFPGTGDHGILDFGFWILDLLPTPNPKPKIQNPKSDG